MDSKTIKTDARPFGPSSSTKKLNYIVKFWVNDGSSFLIRKFSYLSVPLVDNLLRLLQAHSYLVVFKLVTLIL